MQNTLEVAEKCNLEIEFGKLHYPVFHPPEHFTREGYLRHLLAEGLRKRYGIHARAEGQEFIVEGVEDPTRLPTYQTSRASKVERRRPNPALDSDARQGEHAAKTARLSIPPSPPPSKPCIDRLQLELKVIEKTGFHQLLPDRRRLHPLRPRARASPAWRAVPRPVRIVTYLLEISNVDPIRYGLLFERFLNPERVNPPDIDIDFADDRRADVIEYVRQKYGRDAVAQIITFGTMGAKSVVRDVGRVMGLSYGECDRLAKMIPSDLKMTLEKALKQSPELKQAYETEEVTRELIDTAFVLEDLTRNASVHAAGVVIGDQPLVNLLPLKQDEDGTIVTQYAMGPVGDLGLLKMDFLGLKTLTVIRNTCEMVKQTRGIEVPIDHLPLDDAKTYDLLNKANTLGVFQLESGGMRDLCRKFQISSIEHITALIALYRPGTDGPDSGIHQAPPRRGEDRIRASAAGADLPRDLRHPDLPGAGDAGRAGAGRLHARRRGSAAARDGQEEGRGNGQAARQSSSRAARRRTTSRRPRRTRFSICWRSSPATASTSRTPPPTPSSPIRRRI